MTTETGMSPDSATTANSATASEHGASVEFVNVTKVFGAVKAVDAVSLRIDPGEFYSLIGPSGSGKTTLLTMLAGFDRVSSGRILLDGQDISGLPAHRRNMGMVFQSYALFPHMTVAQNVAYPLKLRGIAAGEIHDRVADVLNMVRLPLDEYGHRMPVELSGGQRQRTGLARAIIYDPKVLLMDEPMGALDKNLRDELKIELVRLRERLNVTIIYVTHDQTEALLLSDRIGLMRGGRLVQSGTPADLYERPNSLFTAEFLGEADLLPVRRIDAHGYVISGTDISIRTRTELESSVDESILVLRPEAMSITDPADGLLTGRVGAQYYLGNHFRCEITTPAGTVTVSVDPSIGRSLREGALVGLAFPTEDAVVVQSK